MKTACGIWRSLLISAKRLFRFCLRWVSSRMWFTAMTGRQGLCRSIWKPISATGNFSPEWKRLWRFTTWSSRERGIQRISGILRDFRNGCLHRDKLEAYKDANYLKGGLVYADWITTVSPTYAEEIKMPFYGEGLDGLMRARFRTAQRYFKWHWLWWI